MDPTELLDRVVSAPIEPLLERLREIHRHKSSDPDWLPAADVLRDLRRSRPRAEASTGTGLTPELLPRVVEALRRIDSGRRQRAEAPSYDSVRDHFRSHERELSRRALVTERVLDQLRRGGDVDRVPARAGLQQELRVLCPLGASSAGRFVVANETPDACEVRFQVGTPRRGAPSWAARVTPSFTPAQLHLERDETRVVRAEVSLGGLPARPGERCELPVEVCGRSDTLGLLWLEVVVVDAREEGRE